MRLDVRSLRYRTIGLVVVVIVLPVAWVWLTGVWEGPVVRGIRRDLEHTASEAARVLDEGGDLEQVAHEGRVWVRVLSPAGEIVAEIDRAEPLRTRLMRVPTLAQIDAEQPPVALRPEVKSPGDGRCLLQRDGVVFICGAAARAADGRVVHVMLGSTRVVRSLYEERFQLTALTLVVLGIGVLLAVALGSSMVRPIERLHDQVVARTRGPVSTDPVVLDRRDEVGELATAFNQLLAALEVRNRANTTFAADLAHELKNPVGAVKAAAEALASDRPLAGDRRERLQRVLADASARLEVVVQRFLDLARAEAGLLDAEREPTDLFAMVSSLVDTCRADPRWPHVRFDVAGVPAAVPAVPERLETAVRNLLANAAHFAGEPGRVSVEVAPDGDAVRLVVSDSGPGVRPEDRPHVFERYHTTRVGGTGIGLALTRAIVEAHGGTIGVDDAPGGGARFTIRLPHQA